jgi:dimethylhistidine N-methyltransferase
VKIDIHRTSYAQNSELQQFVKDVRDGLGRPGQKVLPPRYFYDELGSTLFDAITLLPEYGLTRADERLLRQHSRDIAHRFPDCRLVAELGSGSGRKTRYLLEALDHPCYQPIDVSEAALDLCVAQLRDSATVIPIHASYLDGLSQIAAQRRESGPMLVLFLGSTIGNFDRLEADLFLHRVRHFLRPGDGLLLGTDLVKPAHQLIAAYDDPTGVTAAFNKNVLARINRELDANFNLENFQHEARYQAEAQRIEMHLRSTESQMVNIRTAGLMIRFHRGETIWTESSHKFRPDDLDHMAGEAGFSSQARWIDREWPFAENLWIAR